jgi:hypothetical protein
VVDTGDSDRSGFGIGTKPADYAGKRDAVPLGDTHQTEIPRVGVTGALDQMRTHGARGRLQLYQRNRSACGHPIDLHGPRRRAEGHGWGCRGPDEDLVGWRNQTVRVEIGEVGEQAGVEAGTADHLAVGRSGPTHAGKRHDSQELAKRTCGRTDSLRGQPLE